MTRASYLPAVIAVCLLAGCSKSGPDTGAAPAQDSTTAGSRMHQDTTMAMDSSKMMMDSTMKDSSKMQMDSTMQMPADSTKH
jgi:hypothetical protein